MWKYGKQEVFRAERLYTAQNYQSFLETFRHSFPDYVYSCPFRQKEIISAPLDSVECVYVPRKCLQHLSRLQKRDDLQEATLDLVELLSNESRISMEDFGVHGSIALDMHTPKSDIDLVVYGAQNFRRLEVSISKLVGNGVLSYVSKNRIDAARRYKGKYMEKLFMYNAVRELEEINSKYGMFKYFSLACVKFCCKVKDDTEAMFRPAIYRVENYEPANKTSMLVEDKVPRLVTSMIGCYRNVARKGDKIRVSGMLECVENLETGQIYHQVVVGTAKSEEEYIWPL